MLSGSQLSSVGSSLLLSVAKPDGVWCSCHRLKSGPVRFYLEVLAAPPPSMVRLTRVSSCLLGFGACCESFFILPTPNFPTSRSPNFTAPLAVRLEMAAAGKEVTSPIPPPPLHKPHQLFVRPCGVYERLRVCDPEFGGSPVSQRSP